MHFAVQRPRSLFRRATARDDAMSGLVLGVESVPDGLLAGVNPIAGLYA
jgi:SulP family sulfate permease